MAHPAADRGTPPDGDAPRATTDRGSPPGRARRGRPLRRRLDRREVLAPWILLAPALLVLLTLFVGALVVALAQSFAWQPVIGRTDLNLDAYRSLFARPEFWPSLGMSLYVGVVSTLIAIVLGVGAALLLRRLSHRVGLLTFLFQLNLPIPHVVSAAAMTMLLAQSGTLARIAQRADLIDGPADFPRLIFDPFAIGIIASFGWKEVPFIAVIALAQLRSTVVDHEEVAKTLGASPLQRLRHVTVPIILPGVLSASVIVFAFTFGSFEVPRLLGRSYPQLLPVLAVRLHEDVDLTVRPQGMAITVVLAVITVALVAASVRLARSRVRREGR